MVALARLTLVHEWRRFLPAIIAVGFAGLLQLLQTALVLGIFGSASVYITGSTADLWVGYPGTQSVNLGRPINVDVEMRLRMDADIQRVESFRWVDADWRGARDTGGVSVYVCGIDAGPHGLMFERTLPPQLRARLDEPGAVIVDRADLDSLGVKLGDSAIINGQRVHVVGVTSGLRALGGVNVLASLATAQQLDATATADRMTYLVAKVRDPSQAEAVAARLGGGAGFGNYAVWTAQQFAQRSQMYWMFDTGAGAGVLFLAGIVFLVGAVITSQTLVAAIVGSIREYATLNALGVGVNALRKVVMEQAFWVGALGLLGSSVLAGLFFVMAAHYNVPLQLSPGAALACVLLSMILALVSGLAAIRTLRHADPASLLR
ncbi:ABC transporter permease [Pseudomonas palleroniana]|uniref:ABC transporter permease n=1 Tax=Pseudomonas palleroniana TaxID=191390 RepID=A0A1H5I9W0_9PSED|nr:ABC transporter permease [Pseudomonas palleroniana]KAB0567195.1 FtsX-like permease family protein [Pseudomonas palleroniana]PTC23727.1 ABC transporter permease [Pseudomonas palleroniana]SEE36970.1 putative ABC transport system permease protein [Pseudomonas palleroniana]